MSATVTATEVRPMPSTVAHLDALVSTGADGWIVVSAIVDKKWRSASFATDEVDDAARWAARADAAGLNVYLRSNLLDRPLTSQYERGGTADTGTAVALAVDLDVAGPSHAPGKKKHPLPPDRAAAMRIIAGLPTPTLLVSTGDDNTHAWWMLDEPEVDDPVGLLETWADRIVQAGAELGWHVDRPDAARVLRVCGTHRRKPNITPNLVTLESVTGWPEDGLGSRPWSPTGRYGAYDLLDALPVPPPPAPPAAPTKPRREPRPGEVTPADAVSLLSWAEILEPYGWTYVGTGSMEGTACELWLRPGDPTSDHSLKAIPDGPCVNWSDAVGLPVGKGHKLSKFKVFTLLAGLTGSDAARQVGARAREVRT